MGLSGGSGSFQRHVATAPARGQGSWFPAVPPEITLLVLTELLERERERGGGEGSDGASFCDE